MSIKCPICNADDSLYVEQSSSCTIFEIRDGVAIVNRGDVVLDNGNVWCAECGNIIDLNYKWED